MLYRLVANVNRIRYAAGAPEWYTGDMPKSLE